MQAVIPGLTLILSAMGAHGARHAPGATALPPGITLDTLADGIYLFRASSARELWTATNVVVIVNEQDVTVFDSFTRASTARLVIPEIRKLTSKPVRTLINSHWHQDHWSGNDEFQKAWPGLQIVATTETRDYMKRMPGGFFARDVEGDIAATRARLDSAVRTGRNFDGTTLTTSQRETRERDIAELEQFAREIRTVPRVLPTVAFRDTLILWSGQRQFRLYAATGDATGSTVLHLPAEKLLVMGDVLVDIEDGGGTPPWTTNSYAIEPWVRSLGELLRLDVTTIVPGQGRAFRDKHYLQTTHDLFAAVVVQVRAALERGVIGPKAVRDAVNVDAIAHRYVTNGQLPSYFQRWLGTLVDKVYREALDGIGR